MMRAPPPSLCVSSAPHFHVKVHTGALVVSRVRRQTVRRPPFSPHFLPDSEPSPDQSRYTFFFGAVQWRRRPRHPGARLYLVWGNNAHLNSPTSIYLPTFSTQTHTHTHRPHLSINGAALRELIYLISNQLACYHQQ